MSFDDDFTFNIIGELGFDTDEVSVQDVERTVARLREQLEQLNDPIPISAQQRRFEEYQTGFLNLLQEQEKLVSADQERAAIQEQITSLVERQSEVVQQIAAEQREAFFPPQLSVSDQELDQIFSVPDVEESGLSQVIQTSDQFLKRLARTAGTAATLLNTVRAIPRGINAIGEAAREQAASIADSFDQIGVPIQEQADLIRTDLIAAQIEAEAGWGDYASSIAAAAIDSIPFIGSLRQEIAQLTADTELTALSVVPFLQDIQTESAAAAEAFGKLVNAGSQEELDRAIADIRALTEEELFGQLVDTPVLEEARAAIEDFVNDAVRNFDALEESNRRVIEAQGGFEALTNAIFSEVSPAQEEAVELARALGETYFETGQISEAAFLLLEDAANEARVPVETLFDEMRAGRNEAEKAAEEQARAEEEQARRYAEARAAVAASRTADLRNFETYIAGLEQGYEAVEASRAAAEEEFAGALASGLEEQRQRIEGLLQIDFSVNTEDAIDDFEELTGNIQTQLDQFNAREAAALELVPILGADSEVIKALRAGKLDQFLQGEGLELSEVVKLELQLDKVNEAKALALANTVEGNIDLATSALDEGEIRALGGVPGEFLIEGLEQAILDGEMDITSAVLSVLRSAEAAALGPDGLETGSPSKKTYQWGEWMMEGLVNGIDENANAVADASVRVFATVEEALEGKPLFPVEIDAETQGLLDAIVAQRPEPSRDSTANFADFLSGLQEDLASEAEAEAVKLQRSEAAERLRAAGNTLFGDLVAAGNADELLDDILLAPNQAVFDQIEDQLGIQGQTIGEALVDGLVEGVEASEEEYRKSLLTLGESGLQALRDVMLIRSPSRVMYDIGVNVVEGLRLGITENSSLIDAAMTGLSSSIAAPTATPGSVGGSVDNSRTVNVYPATVGDDLILAKMILAGL